MREVPKYLTLLVQIVMVMSMDLKSVFMARYSTRTLGSHFLGAVASEY